MVSAETMKWASLVIFTFQNAAFVLFMRASKVYGSHYNSSVAVLVTEMLKLPFTCLLLCYEKSSVSGARGKAARRRRRTRGRVHIVPNHTHTRIAHTTRSRTGVV